MEFRTEEHRHALHLVNHGTYEGLFQEFIDVIIGISDEDIITEFEERRSHEITRFLAEGKNPDKNGTKSISRSINALMKSRLEESGWITESPIFAEPAYNGGRSSRWRLDFAKKEFSVEVAFNHGEAIAHNIMKPVLASELNHVEKAIQTSIGIVVFATEDMKTAGNFDNAVGSFEKALSYLKPYRNFITCPLIIIGLEAPISFKIRKENRTIQRIGYKL